jgi:hypothetical protein
VAQYSGWNGSDVGQTAGMLSCEKKETYCPTSLVIMVSSNKTASQVAGNYAKVRMLYLIIMELQCF